MIIHLGNLSPDSSSDLPGNYSFRNWSGRLRLTMFDLAPYGVCRALPVTREAVRSYRTISPLLWASGVGCLERYIFCGTFPRIPPGFC